MRSWTRNSGRIRASLSCFCSLLERAIAALVKVSRRLPPKAALDLLKSGTDVDLFQSLLSNAAVLDQLTQPRQDPLLNARVRGAHQRQAILSGPEMLSAKAAAELLGMTRQGVDARRKSDQLLALEGGARGYKYPVWQFEEGKVLPGLGDVLSELRALGPWLKYHFFNHPDPYLGERRPIDVLREGDLEAVREAARRYASGDQGGS